jgi:cytochrome c-type biogenesis protein CcmH/NrfG
VLATLVGALLSVLTFRQAGIWKNSVTLGIREIELDPSSPPATLLQRASLHGRAGHFQAIADCTEALRLKPENADVWALCGRARLASSDNSGAAQDFGRTLEIAPPTWPQRRPVELFLLEAQTPK